MTMGDHEIRVEYMRAKDKAKQVKILAQLNGCSVEDIKAALIRAGCDARGVCQVGGSRKKKTDETEAEIKASVPERVSEPEPAVPPRPIAPPAPVTIATGRKEILTTAINTVCGQREQDYGSPEDNFKIIAGMWGAYLGTEINAVDVAMMMGLLKIARIKTGTGTMDSFADLAGYAACGGEIAMRMRG